MSVRLKACFLTGAAPLVCPAQTAQVRPYDACSRLKLSQTDLSYSLQESASPAPPAASAMPRRKTFTVTRGMTGSLPESSSPSKKKRKVNYAEDSDDISVADSLTSQKDDPADYSYQPSDAGSDFRAPAPPRPERTHSAPDAPGMEAEPLTAAPYSAFFSMQDHTFPTHPNAPQAPPTHYMTHGRRHTVADLKSIHESASYGHHFGHGHDHAEAYVSTLFVVTKAC